LKITVIAEDIVREKKRGLSMTII